MSIEQIYWAGFGACAVQGIINFGLVLAVFRLKAKNDFLLDCIGRILEKYPVASISVTWSRTYHS